MLVLVSCLPVQAMVTVLFNITDHANNAMGMTTAALTGSVLMLPGFIVFPLCGVFAEKGVPYFILSAFTTTMMLVGVVTFPVEKSYLGAKLALMRNMIGFGIALVVAVITGIFIITMVVLREYDDVEANKKSANRKSKRDNKAWQANTSG